MTSDAPLAEGQAQAARDAIRQGLVPIERYRDPVTELGRNPDTERWGNGWGRNKG